MRFKVPSIVVALLLLPGLAVAQEGTIAGTVVDSTTSESLPGVNVVVQGLNIGAATDANGRFEISGVPAGTQTIVASFVGYSRKRVAVSVEAGQTTTVNIRMAQGAVGLEDVVVTALGVEQEQRSLGYATSQVEGSDVATAGEANLTDALAGEVPGLSVTSSGGQPGSGTRITIRGNSSFSQGGNTPLVVVDGMIVSNASTDYDNAVTSDVLTGGTSNRLLDVDPNSIKSINVLKGASATALYGSRAANGAIIIETKSGEGTQGINASFTSTVGVSDAIIDGYQDEYLQGASGAYRNGLPFGRGGYNEQGDPDSPHYAGPVAGPILARATQTSLNWGPHKDSLSQAVIDSIGQPQIYNPREAFYERAFRAENSLTISGSGDFGNARLTISDSRNDGIVPTSNYNRTNVSAKYSANYTESFGVQVSTQYTQSGRDYMLAGNGPNSYRWGLIAAPINFDITDTEFDDGTQRNFAATNRDNPLWFTKRQSVTSDVNRFIGNFRATYDITDWLTVREDLGVDTYSNLRNQEVNAGTEDEPSGFLSNQRINRTEINSTLDARIDRDLTDDLSLDLIVGNDVSWRELERGRSQGSGIGVTDFFNIANFSSISSFGQTQRQSLISGFGKLTLNYRDYAYLTLTGRNDWSSTLPDGERSYFYPSGSFTFIFTDAFDGVFGDSPLNFGKLRFNLSQVGSDTDPYQIETTYLQAGPGDGQRGNINFPFNGLLGYTRENVRANPGLEPELTTEYELGANLQFFSNRVGLDVTYYDRTTDGQIFNVPVSATTGFSSQSRNAGVISNRGWEVQLNGTVLDVGDFSWDLTANWSTNTTEVEELAEGVENIYLFGFTAPQIRAEQGTDGYGIIYGSRYLRNGMISEDNPVVIDGEERTSPLSDFGDDALIIGSDGTPVIAGGNGNIGNVQPDWEGGVSSTFSWKGLTLSQQWEVSQGRDILNFDKFYMQLYGTHESTLDRGTEVTEDGIQVDTGEPNETSYVKDQGYYLGPDLEVFSRFVEDGSYVKLRQVSLSYQFSLPESVRTVGLNTLQLRLTGRNLVTFTDFSMGDPASGSLAGTGNGQGFYHAVTPSTRSYQASVTFNF